MPRSPAACKADHEQAHGDCQNRNLRHAHRRKDALKGIADPKPDISHERTAGTGIATARRIGSRTLPAKPPQTPTARANVIHTGVLAITATGLAVTPEAIRLALVAVTEPANRNAPKRFQAIPPTLATINQSGAREVLREPSDNGESPGAMRPRWRLLQG